RINSTDLRCRVVGEGGNLGFTQRARIEFALRGGKINTAAIDNSGGVDLSDHEVNLKILFAEAIAEGKLTLEQRDEYLQNVVDEVVESVLSNNRSQARSLSHGERRSLTQIDFYSPLIAFLHRNAFLNRDLEALPDDDDLKERVRQHLGLTRPELSTVMAGAKMWMKSMLLESKLVEDPSLEEDLLFYFPESIREPFRNEILGHPLAKNILALQIVNSVVDLFGMSFVFRLSQASSVKPLDVLKCCIIAERLLKGRYLGAEYSKLDTAENNELFINIKTEVGSALRKTAAWYLSYHREGKVADLVWTFSSAHAELIDGLTEILDEDERLLSEDLFKKYKKAGLSDDISRRLSLLSWIREALQILWVSRLAGSSIRSAAYVFKRMLNIVGLRKILNTRGYFQFKDKWDYELFNVCADDMWKVLTLFSARLIQTCGSDEQRLNSSLAELSGLEDFLVISQSLLDKNLSISGIAVLARKLNEACTNHSLKA
ncbi:MAG: NAD-glutamate dehydrogenase, partial [SAR324 cluster bacterium]|nr:NAD-glutamate dehydrogenase [SAR324 cluster bacterium]